VFVDVATVPEGDDDNQQHVIVEGVDDAVVTYSYPPCGSTAEWPSGRWPRILRQQSDHTLNAAGDRRVESTKGSDGSWPQLDPVAAHSQPRSTFA
jgi:hypothetical protein